MLYVMWVTEDSDSIYDFRFEGNENVSSVPEFRRVPAREFAIDYLPG